jgi:hypothetical protein
MNTLRRANARNPMMFHSGQCGEFGSQKASPYAKPLRRDTAAQDGRSIFRTEFNALEAEKRRKQIIIIGGLHDKETDWKRGEHFIGHT